MLRVVILHTKIQTTSNFRLSAHLQRGAWYKRSSALRRLDLHLDLVLDEAAGGAIRVYNNASTLLMLVRGLEERNTPTITSDTIILHTSSFEWPASTLRLCVSSLSLLVPVTPATSTSICNLLGLHNGHKIKSGLLALFHLYNRLSVMYEYRCLLFTCLTRDERGLARGYTYKLRELAK